MATPDLAPDLWRDLMENEIGLDRYGNYTVPSLARCAKLRLVCTSVREANKILQTPYDARVVYSDAKKAVPIRFSGGMHFGSLHGSLVAFSIVRDRDNGQMFAVTNHYLGCDDAGVLWCEVVRTYSLYRLAELLNGHSPDWGARLPDVHELAYRNTGQSLHGFRAKQPTIFALGNSRGAVTKNQLVAKEYKGSPAAGVGLHYDDCISNQLLEWRRPTPPPPPWGGTVSRAKAEYYKQPGLVLITSRDGEPVKVRALDWCFARVGVIGTVLARHDFHRPVVDVEAGDSEVTISAYADRVHVLGKALGWDCAPEIVKELAGHASLLSHGKAPALPTAFDSLQLHYHHGQPQRWPDVTLKLEEMAEAARKLRDEEEAERAHFQAQVEKLLPGTTKKRERRGAAAAAEQALAAASMGSVNLDGSVDPKKFRLQCSRSDRASQSRSNKDAIREQEEAGGSDNWHYENQARRDAEWAPPKRSRPSTPKPKPVAPGASCSFLDFLNAM